MRDENGFKCQYVVLDRTQHFQTNSLNSVQSESHVRQMLLIGEDPRKHIHQYSEEFKKNFVDLLKTTHGEKKVHINHFYQEV